MPNYGHLPLSCAKIERPSPPEKPSCKVRLFVQNRSREYLQKVTATMLFQTAFHRIFQLHPQTARVCFRRQKWVHTRPCSKNRTQRLTRRNRGLPSLDHSAALRCLRNHSNQLHLQPLIPPCFYIHTFPGSLWPPTISNSSISDHLSSRFSTSLTNGPRSISQVKAGTHSALLKGSHTRAYTPKQGRFGRGWYHYPRIVLRSSETLRGQVSERQTLPLWGLGRRRSRRTQSACGTAMRSCGSLVRGVAVPLGCVIRGEHL